MTGETTEKTVTIASNGLRAEIATHGAELQRLTDSEGRDLLWNGDPAFWGGRAPILFPVIGMLVDNCYRMDGESHPMTKHGFARDSDFTLVAQNEASVLLRLSPTGQSRALYPFEFRLDISFVLAERTLRIMATIVNDGDRPMPASFGFHPAFCWPLPFGAPRADHHVFFDSDEPAPIRRIDSNGFLTPERHPTPIIGNDLALRDALFVDDAMILDMPASRSLRYGAPGFPQLRVDFSDFPALGLWTKPGAPFLCIEPWQGFADPQGFQDEIWEKPGIVSIAPGQSRDFAMTVSLIDAA